MLYCTVTLYTQYCTVHITTGTVLRSTTDTGKYHNKLLQYSNLVHYSTVFIPVVDSVQCGYRYVYNDV